ncbi:hypothetical protein GCM10017044_10630 [Kordiimonas sediminis]|uniref:Uncharacterized protein n=1 Tax=Kordiimonas sediminis TaxID=1735581 RepID=A0A919APK5_9PROT|nr:hypothetical protein GCM10017044_10630 [Kordiimonas sediminis]
MRFLMVVNAQVFGSWDGGKHCFPQAVHIPCNDSHEKNTKGAKTSMQFRNVGILSLYKRTASFGNRLTITLWE